MTTRLRYPLDLVLFAQKYLREEHPGEDFNDLALLNEALDDAKLGPLLRYSYKHNNPSLPRPLSHTATGEDTAFLREEKGRKYLEKTPIFTPTAVWEEWLKGVLVLIPKE